MKWCEAACRIGMWNLVHVVCVLLGVVGWLSWMFLGSWCNVLQVALSALVPLVQASINL
jgi:hypothetical protein